jgi:hypothetical protein
MAELRPKKKVGSNVIRPERAISPDTFVKSKIYPADFAEISGGSDAKENFSVDSLVNSFRDLAKQNLFKVRCIPPPVNGSVGLAEQEFITNLIKSASFPSVEVGKIPLIRAGSVMNMPGDSKYGDLSITFWADEDHNVRSYFHQWHQMYVSNYNEFRGGYYPTTVKGRVIIQQLSSDFTTTYAIECIGAWPSSIGEITLDHESEHTRQQFTVSFSYIYYVPYINVGK